MVLRSCHERCITRRATLRSIAATFASSAASHIFMGSVGTAAYGPDALKGASSARSPHSPLAAVRQFRDDPHVAGQRSSYLENQSVTPTGRFAALFTEKERGYNGY